jgi:hypothetical protein
MQTFACFLENYCNLVFRSAFISVNQGKLLLFQLRFVLNRCSLLVLLLSHKMNSTQTQPAQALPPAPLHPAGP